MDGYVCRQFSVYDLMGSVSEGHLVGHLECIDWQMSKPSVSDCLKGCEGYGGCYLGHAPPGSALGGHTVLA